MRHFVLCFGNKANQQVRPRSVEEMQKCLLSNIEKNAVILIQFKQTKIFYLEHSLNHSDLKNNRAER